MAIKKEIVLEMTGATAAFHVIKNVAIDAAAGITVASISSYVSEQAYKSGKQALQLAASISVSGVPQENEGAFPYIHRRLIEAKPEDENQDAGTPMIYNVADRYLLAGGEIVAD
ncbi:MAG: hypothetical protein VB131_03740 [Burkholderia gladioli]